MRHKELSSILLSLLLALGTMAAGASEKFKQPSVSEVDTKIAQFLARINKMAQEDATKIGDIDDQLIKYLKSICRIPLFSLQPCLKQRKLEGFD